jgi:hypothetical protein
VVAAERFDEDQVIVAGVLDVVAAVAPDQADIAGPEIGGVHLADTKDAPHSVRKKAPYFRKNIASLFSQI